MGQERPLLADFYNFLSFEFLHVFKYDNKTLLGLPIDKEIILK